VATGLVGLSLIGEKALQRRLKRLPVDIRRKVVRSMMQGGGTVLAKFARREAPVGAGKKPDGSTRQHLNQVIIRRVSRSGQSVAVGPIYKAAPHDILVHDGTKPHSLGKLKTKLVFAPGRGRKGGMKKLRIGQADGPQHPGSKPNPYMLRAMDKAHAAVFAKVASVAEKRIAKLTE
jgi:hypothetical protein